MFNSPALDIGLGLIFIFLLYSLLATSMQEATATALNLRAAMLKKSIVENMLADTSDGSRILIWARQCRSFVVKLPYLVGLAKKRKDRSLGGRFYDHPLIKNYGESKMFPIPSYIPTKNFSAVLLDILLKDFNVNLEAIVVSKMNTINEDVAVVKEQLQSLPLTYKIKELLDFHLGCYEKSAAHRYFLECDTCRILEMHLRNSHYDVEAFSRRLEGWFDDSMRRVSGWYKRKSQFILFLIGMGMALAFNIDILQIAGKLSTDKDARDKLATMAVQASEKYKDDARVMKRKDAVDTDTLKNSETQYQEHIGNARALLEGDINDTNQLLALGWNGFGRHDSIYLIALKKRYGEEINYEHLVDSVARHDSLKRVSMAKDMKQKIDFDSTVTAMAVKYDSIATDAWYIKVKEAHPVKVRAGYVLNTLQNNPRNFIGYFIFAFGICLGAPFWFDILGELVNVRGAGKKETAATTAPSIEPEKQPVQIAINSKDGEEAVG